MKNKAKIGVVTVKPDLSEYELISPDGTDRDLYIAKSKFLRYNKK